MFTLFDIKIDFEKSHGSYLHDKKTGTDYLDFFSMYSSLPLGHNHPVFDSEFERRLIRIGKLKMANNAFHSDELQDFMRDFMRHSPLPNVHFCCTGALAVESALKCAMVAKKAVEPLVYGITQSFHGVNSWGFATDVFAPTAKRLEHLPRLKGWSNMELDALIKVMEGEVDPRLVAVIVEPVQCTAGDIYLDPAKLRYLRELCRKQDVAYVVDEIQTGFGTTGSMWYSQKIGLDPDIIVFGKKAQISGILTNDRYNGSIVDPSMKLHVTFDGDLVDAVRSQYVLRAYEQGDLVRRAGQNAPRFRRALEGKVMGLRGEGHLLAFDFPTPQERDRFIQGCRQRNFLCNVAGTRTVRMRPSMAISELELQHFEQIMDEVLRPQVRHKEAECSVT